MSDYLKPCPFCSCEELDPHDDKERALHVVECMVCGASATGASEEEARDAWNTRADGPQWIELPEYWAKSSEIFGRFLVDAGFVELPEDERQMWAAHDPSVARFRVPHEGGHRIVDWPINDAGYRISEATHIAKWTPPKEPE